MKGQVDTVHCVSHTCACQWKKRVWRKEKIYSFQSLTHIAVGYLYVWVALGAQRGGYRCQGALWLMHVRHWDHKRPNFAHFILHQSSTSNGSIITSQSITYEAFIKAAALIKEIHKLECVKVFFKYRQEWLILWYRVILHFNSRFHACFWQ